MRPILGMGRGSGDAMNQQLVFMKQIGVEGVVIGPWDQQSVTRGVPAHVPR